MAAKKSGKSKKSTRGVKDLPAKKMSGKLAKGIKGGTVTTWGIKKV